MVESIEHYWAETMAIPGANWIVSIFGLVTCVLVAVYVVKAFRDLALGKGKPAVSHLDEFKKMRLEGKIDQEEYKRLKKALPDHVNVEVPDATTRSDKLAGGVKSGR